MQSSPLFFPLLPPHTPHNHRTAPNHLKHQHQQNTGSPGPLSPVSTISNGPAPTIPDAPDSPRGFDHYSLSSAGGYGYLSSHGGSQTASPGSQHSYNPQQDYQQHHLDYSLQQFTQPQQSRPVKSAPTPPPAPMYSSYNGSGSGGTLTRHHDSYGGAYGDQVRSHSVTNGSGDGTYASVGSRDSYASSSRGYREEEPRYPK